MSQPAPVVLDAEQFRRVQELFSAARELPPEQRPTFLAGRCGDGEAGAAVRAEVESLLAHVAASERLLDDRPLGASFHPREALDAAAAAAAGTAPAAPPRFSGPVPSIAGYQVLGELGRGGQAVVYLAAHEATGRKLAVKVTREGPLADAARRARFDREAQILSALNHPGIVTFVDRGTTADGSQFLAMNYVAGRTLEDILRDHARPDMAAGAAAGAGAGHPPDPADLLKLFVNVCDAVNAAHLRGVVHRDLKPSNILVDEHGESHVLDFGLARPGLEDWRDDSQGGGRGPVTTTGQFLGSLPWASPEQAEGDPKKIDTRTDVYALGVILYQILTGGQFPYDVAGPLRDALTNIMTADPRPPSSVVEAAEMRAARRGRGSRGRRRPRAAPGVDAVLDAIALKAMRKRREDRYQTAGELARDLTSHAAGLPTTVAALRRPPRWLRWAGPAAAAAGRPLRVVPRWLARPAAVALVTGFVTAAACGGVYAWRYYGTLADIRATVPGHRP
jgi:serine/threonine protein kinase